MWLFSVALMAAGAAGCQVLPDKAMSGPADDVVYDGFTMPPRIRYGTYPSSMVGTPFLGRDFGSHGYYYRWSEKNGIAYACRGGHLDVMHLRIAADWTAYLAARTYRHLMKNDRGFSFKLAVDRSRNYVQFSYPRDWRYMSRQQRSAVAREVAMVMGPYLAFTTVTWHEILTWYGFKCIGLPVEYDSAFSWEDSYSNLVGTRIALRALQDTEHSYNRAVEIAMEQEMEELGIQSAHTAKRASESMRGEWYTGNFALFIDMKKRNFDIGLDDGYITPTLVPEVSECPDAEPISYPIPTLDALSKFGFSATLEIEPHEWEKNKILRIVYPHEHRKRIRPDLHFAQIMEQIQREAAAKYGPEYSPDGHMDAQYVTTAE